MEAGRRTEEVCGQLEKAGSAAGLAPHVGLVHQLETRLAYLMVAEVRGCDDLMEGRKQVIIDLLNILKPAASIVDQTRRLHHTHTRTDDTPQAQIGQPRTSFKLSARSPKHRPKLDQSTESAFAYLAVFLICTARLENVLEEPSPWSVQR